MIRRAANRQVRIHCASQGSRGLVSQHRSDTRSGPRQASACTGRRRGHRCETLAPAGRLFLGCPSRWRQGGKNPQQWWARRLIPSRPAAL